MKKTLIALAVLAASGAAVAQSSVTISGLLDFAAGQVGGNSKGTTISTRDVTSATSVIRITAVEDLGGGMRATVNFGLDPRQLANDNNLGSTTAAGSTNNSFNRDETFVGLSGGFGNLRLGSPNSIGLTTFLAGSPLGTGIGSGYAATGLDYSAIRYDRSARYDSPAINGFTLSALYAPGGDQGANALVSFIPNNTAVTEIGLRYAKGPLTIAFANVSQAAQTNAAAATVLPAVPAVSVKTSSNILAASYVMGATTLSAGWNDGDARARAATATARTSEGYRFGVAHTMGAISLMASYGAQETQTATATPKETVMGLRADYALSKRTVTYVGYESYDTGVAAAGTPITGTRKIASVGVRHSF
jgi:predicted porin